MAGAGAAQGGNNDNVGGRRGGLARLRGAAAGAAGAGAAAAGGAGDDNTEEQNERQAHQQQRAEEVRLARQREQRDRQEAQSAKATSYAEKQRQKQEERERREKAIEDEVRRLAEEKAKAAQAEFDDWKNMFSVETAGSGEADAASVSQEMLSKFVERIQKRKVMPLDEIAAEYKMKVTDAVKRIEALEASNLLTGVMDDRGKYVYLSLDELDRVAKFVNRKGRVSIADVVTESNKLIDMNPVEDDIAVPDLVLEDEKSSTDVPAGA